MNDGYTLNSRFFLIFVLISRKLGTKKDLHLCKSLFYMALPGGFEPPTCPLGGGRAIQLCQGSIEKPAG